MSKSYVTEQLERLLETFRAMPSLPQPGTPEAVSAQQDWMKRFKQVESLEFQTYHVALLALPPDIYALYEAVNNERCRVLGIGKFYQKEGNSESR